MENDATGNPQFGDNFVDDSVGAEGVPQVARPTAPAQLTQPSTQPQPQVRPQVRPQSETPEQNHASMFQNIFGVLAGGKRIPVRDATGNPVTDAKGQVVTKPATVKQLGAGILAGALASMMAGFEHLPERNGNGIVTSHMNEAAAAGAQAGAANSQNARVQQAQGEADKQKLQQYTTIKQNMELQSMALTNARLGDEAIDRTTAHFADMHNWLSTEAMNDPAIADYIKGDELGHDEMISMMQNDEANGTKDTAIPAGSRPEIGPDGKPTGKLEQTWMVISNNATIKLTPALKEKYGMTNVPDGTTVPLSILMQNGMNSNVAAGVSQIMDKIQADSEEMSGKPASSTWADILKKNPSFRSPAAMRAMQGLAGLAPEQAVEVAKKFSGFGPALSAALATAFNIDEKDFAEKRAIELKKEQNKVALELDAAKEKQKASTPEGQMAIKNKELQNKKLQMDIDDAERAAVGLEVPPNYKMKPGAVKLDQVDLQRDLASQGVKIPGNFAHLYMVAHNEAPLDSLPTRPMKGTFQMSQQDGGSFIRTFINPEYNAADYPAAKKLKEELASLKPNTAGGVLAAAGVASQHLELLAQAGDALESNDLQTLNKLANAFNVETGKSPVPVFKAIAEQVSGEVGKVVVGGTPHEAELLLLRDKLNAAQSASQVHDVVKAYVGMMSGRINEYNDRSVQYFGKNVRGISPMTRRVFAKYGFETPESPEEQDRKAQASAVPPPPPGFTVIK